MGITISVYLSYVSFIRSLFPHFFLVRNHEDAEDVRLFGDRNHHHFVQRRSGIETGGIAAGTGNIVEKGNGNRSTLKKRYGGLVVDARDISRSSGRSGIETGGIAARRGNLVEKGNGNRSALKKRYGGMEAWNISRSSG